MICINIQTRFCINKHTLNKNKFLDVSPGGGRGFDNYPDYFLTLPALIICYKIKIKPEYFGLKFDIF